MANLLAIHDHYPMPDRASGELRFFTMLRILAAQHHVYFSALDRDGSSDGLTPEQSNHYKSQLIAAGVEVLDLPIVLVLQAAKFDMVIFEFFSVAQPYVHLARFFQPMARIVVDSVDVHFQRLLAKAAVTCVAEDMEEARGVKRQEMAVYSACDVVIAVSEDDRRCLNAENSAIPVALIPNIHAIETRPQSTGQERNTLIFIGGFRHEPNADAVLYFVREVLPLIRKQVPSVHVRIIGSWPPREITEMQGADIEVLGYVEQVTPYLLKSDISIAPLRYGAGMKGKVGEAMAHGLPVVTTSIGIEGFGLTPGANVLVGDDPEAFAAQVVRLLRDAELCRHIGENGLDFIRQNYSVESVTKQLLAAVEWMLALPVKNLPLGQWLRLKLAFEYHRRVGWRFGAN